MTSQSAQSQKIADMKASKSPDFLNYEDLLDAVRSNDSRAVKEFERIFHCRPSDFSSSDLYHPSALGLALWLKADSYLLSQDYARAFDLLQPAVDLGCTGANYQLGCCYLRKEAKDKDKSNVNKAIECFKKTPDIMDNFSQRRSYFEAILRLGDVCPPELLQKFIDCAQKERDGGLQLQLGSYYDKEGIAPDLQQAIYWYSKAAVNGWDSAAEAAFKKLLGLDWAAYRDIPKEKIGLGSPADVPREISACGLFVEARQEPVASTVASAAKPLPQSGLDAKRLLPPVEQKQVAAELFKRGQDYYEGRHVKADKVEALNFFLQAALKGSWDAQEALMKMGPKFISQWYKVVYDDPETQYLVAKEYITEKSSLGENVELAIDWALKAGDQRQLAAHDILTSSLSKECLLAYYEACAERGDPRMQFRLAQCYEEGTCGLEKNRESAVIWYGKSAVQKHGYARLAQESFERLSPDGAELPLPSATKVEPVDPLPVSYGRFFSNASYADETVGASSELVPRL